MSSKSADAFRTISEVAEWLDTPAHVLRFWESKFSQIKPVKRAGGRRYYRPADMQLLGGIKKLLHDDGMTIKGAQKLLRENGIRYVAALSQPLDDDLERFVTPPSAPEAPSFADRPPRDVPAIDIPPLPDEGADVVPFAGGASNAPAPLEEGEAEDDKHIAADPRAARPAVSEAAPHAPNTSDAPTRGDAADAPDVSATSPAAVSHPATPEAPAVEAPAVEAPVDAALPRTPAASATEAPAEPETAPAAPESDPVDMRKPAPEVPEPMPSAAEQTSTPAEPNEPPASSPSPDPTPAVEPEVKTASEDPVLPGFLRRPLGDSAPAPSADPAPETMPQEVVAQPDAAASEPAAQQPTPAPAPPEHPAPTEGATTPQMSDAAPAAAAPEPAPSEEDAPAPVPRPAVVDVPVDVKDEDVTGTPGLLSKLAERPSLDAHAETLRPLVARLAAVRDQMSAARRS